MNSTFFSRRLALVLFAFATATITVRADQDPPSQPGTLQVRVNIPPTWQPMLEDQVSEAFVTHLSDVFHRQGFKGEIKEVRWLDEASAGCCLLTVDLYEWRMNPIGNIDCAFTANLQTERTTRHIPGTFNGMAFRWMNGPGRFGLADSFGQAADDAIRQLYDALAKTELLPGTRK